MSDNWTEPVAALIREGRFATALERLRACSPYIHGTARDLHTVLLAQVLQQTGAPAEARRAAQALLKSGSLSRSLRSRCHILVGNACRQEGKFPDALQHYQKAIALAHEDSDLEHVCWARTRLMMAVAESAGGEAAVALLAELRHDVAQLGDPTIATALHVFLAEIEAKRGLFNSAQNHLRAAQALLDTHPNAWLHGLLDVISSGLCWMQSDIDGAIAHARSALQCADISGDSHTRRAAIGNLGLMYIHKGEFDLAERYLQDGLRRSTHSRETEIGILDTYAQLEFAREDWDECEVLLDRIHSAITEMPISHWNELRSFQTRIRLLHRQNRWPEAIQLATNAIALATRRADRPLAVLLRLLKAEGLIMTGRPEEATVLIAEATSGDEGIAVETLAEIERVKGKAFARFGQLDAAAHHLERAWRILTVTGNVCARTDVTRDWNEALPSTAGLLPSARQMSAVNATPAPGRPYSARLSRDLTSVPVAEAQRLASLVMEGAAGLLDVAGCPELLGREALSLLIDSRSVQTTALIVRDHRNGRWEVVASHGSAEEPTAEKGGHVRLPLGATNGSEFELLIDPAGDLASQDVVLALQKLVKGALALEAARQDQRQRTELWPAEPLADACQGVFAADNMVAILTMARKIAAVDVPVLLTGETGTGKEVLARVLHASSPRAPRPFVPFNCTSVPSDLLASQLFGHRRGAFTGAHVHFPGVIRSAEGGTLFLDEIGELGPEVQPKLLRFLDSGEIQALGEPRPTTSDVRVIAATNADIERLVAEGKFREDLFYRLNVVRLHVPPLRQRREEIPLLVRHFLERYSEEFRKPHLRIAEATMEYLLLHEWPGNVRQLANEVRRLAALSEPGAVLAPEHLSPEITAGRRTLPAGPRLPGPHEVLVRLDQPLSAAIEHLERAMVPYALQSAAGRAETAAKAMGISRKGFYLKRRRLHLPAGVVSSHRG